MFNLSKKLRLKTRVTQHKEPDETGPVFGSVFIEKAHIGYLDSTGWYVRVKKSSNP